MVQNTYKPVETKENVISINHSSNNLEKAYSTFLNDLNTYAENKNIQSNFLDNKEFVFQADDYTPLDYLKGELNIKIFDMNELDVKQTPIAYINVQAGKKITTHSSPFEHEGRDYAIAKTQHTDQNLYARISSARKKEFSNEQLANSIKRYLCR